MRTAALLLLLLSALGCKGDRDKCTKAAQHFAELMYWEKANADIAKLPLEQQDAERKRKLVEFTRELDAQLDFRITQCVSAANDRQSECIIAAKTRAEALECAEIAKGPESSRGLCQAGGSPAGPGLLAALLALTLRRRRRRTWPAS
jgi:MYXO-CTERM domain-containing protein